jgi:hypothetical protein
VKRLIFLFSLALFGLVLTADSAFTPSDLLKSVEDSEHGYRVVTRGKDFALLQKVTTITNAGGIVASTTNAVTLLENSLHYFADGEWKVSQDVIEPFPDGAIARHGPYRTIFSTELNAEAVFDIELPEGSRIRGGVRAIQLTDLRSGKSVVLATVRETVRGEVVPPNQVVYRSGFDGLDADVLFVWQHNSLSQNVILKQRPVLPAGMDPATTRLEVVSELVESPEPVLNRPVLKEGSDPNFHDVVTIGLGSMLALRGKAFPVDDARALVLTGDNLFEEGGVFVGKEFFQVEDGRKFIIESVAWPEVEPMLMNLDTASVDRSSPAELQMAESRVWPRQVPALSKQEPLQMAGLPYKTSGFLIDLDLSGSVSSYTFLSGTTYYIPQSFYINPGLTTFQPGCTIKYGNDAWLLMHGPISCPASGQYMPVLTSKDDDLFGVMIPGSTHNPTHMARQALLVYYVEEYQTEINNMRIRWANKGIEYDAYSGIEVTHNLSDSLFQNCKTNAYGIMPDGTLVLNNVRFCTTTLPVGGTYGFVSGTMTKDCRPFQVMANFSGLKQQDTAHTVPDTMGAVGPNHFMVLFNGVGGANAPWTAAAIFDKSTGAKLAGANIFNFFLLTVPSGPYAGTYPSGGSFYAFDPRIIFDHGSQRWIACAIDNSSGHVLLAVSNGPDPVGDGGQTWVADNWKKYLVPFTNCIAADYDTLGVDGNGIYIKVSNCSGGQKKVAALPKLPLTATSRPFSNPSTRPRVPRGLGSRYAVMSSRRTADTSKYKTHLTAERSSG